MGGVLLLIIMGLCLAGFVAAFVDSIAGGGGLISIPAFLLAGVPPHFALGTNKFAATAASLTSSIKYARSAKINRRLLLYLAPLTLVGAVLGVKTVVRLDQRLLQTLVLVMIIGVGAYSLFSRQMGLADRFRGIDRPKLLWGMLLALGLGFYDGFFGPGTGSFLIFGLIGIYGFDFINAGGNARVLNFVSNVTSLVLFAWLGKIDYRYGVPVALAMMVGAQLGTMLALQKGVKLIKPIFVAMSLAVAVKILWGLVRS
jgi:uncharacterized membrane protein YfcA